MEERAAELAGTKEGARSAGARLRRALRGLAVALVWVALAVVGAGWCVTSFGERGVHWRGMEVRLALRPAREGGTRIELPPLGAIRAATHRAPVELVATLRRVSLDTLRETIAEAPSRSDLEREFRATSAQALRSFGAWCVAMGALGGLLAPLALRSRRPAGWLGGPLLGAAATGALLLAVVRGYDLDAFERPRYTGSLREAPSILAAARDAFARVDTLSQRLTAAAHGIGRLYSRIDRMAAPPRNGNAIALLHISDLHNNRAAAGLIRALAEEFGVAAVVNTGDLTDFGYPVEAQLWEVLKGIRRPHLFVPGNHDSPEVIEAMRRLPGGLVPDHEVATVAGLRILAAPDPSAGRAGAGNVDTAPAAMTAAAERLARAFDAAQPPPDIVAVHDRRQAALLIGRARVVLCGHTHTNSVAIEQGTVVANAGSTGAAGARYLDRPEGVPLSASVLHFERNGALRLLWIDRVVLEGTLGEMTVTRTAIPPPTPPAAQAGRASPAPGSAARPPSGP